MMTNVTRADVISLLGSNKAVVTFLKKDGTLRDLFCTRNFEVIPSEAHPKSESTRQVNEEVITAYDLEKSAWRSFRVDSIRAIEVVA